MSLRPAKEVREEINSRKEISRSKSVQKQLADIARKIEDNKHQGWVSSLTVMPEVEVILKHFGYKIDHHRAIHCGDIDSITIKW